ncbi:MAG: hypothetical protein GTO24_16000 [candidate division Zixibacteria bacterium]|nr:hypothetical protein [candidate division Zixibacteria bacterium]
MSASTVNFSLEVEGTDKLCPVGEVAAKKMMAEGKIPVISCEGGCIRGEIARLAANLVEKEEPYGRGCHGEMFTAPHSAMANWAKRSDKVVVIDGCFMHCHGRIMKNLLREENVLQFDALSIYKKYTDLIEIDDVPEPERKQVAQQVADQVLSSLRTELGK